MTSSKRSTDPVVYCLSKPSRCHNCDARLDPGALVQLLEGKDEREAHCIKCAGLDSFRVVRAGDAKVTRLAKKYSPKRYVILKWSELWKTYERQGLLVEAEAVEKIEQEVGKVV